MIMASLTKDNIYLGLAYSSEGQSISIRAGSMAAAGRHGAGEGAGSSIPGSAGIRKRKWATKLGFSS